MSSDASETAPRDPSRPARKQGQGDRFDAGPLGVLPRLSRGQVRLAERLARLATGRGVLRATRWLEDALGTSLEAGPAELIARASGLLRPALVAQFSWPSRHARLGLAIETPLGHAIVDRLLGFERTDAEARRQLTPVEWGILTFIVARSLEALALGPRPLGLDDLVLDRVGPESFATGDLGAVVTLRWPVRVGTIAGAVRLWIGATTLAGWLDEALPSADGAIAHDARLDALASTWRAEAGTVAMPRGLASLRVGGVLPIDDSTLRGTPQSPLGVLRLVLDLADRRVRCVFPVDAVPLSGGGQLTVTSTLQHDPLPREALPVSSSAEFSPPSIAVGPAPTDIPVTLTVELGRVNLTLGRLADLRPGDVIELARHSREPVELTSGGRLVARGELVQIDTELGVRVTQVFL